METPGGNNKAGPQRQLPSFFKADPAAAVSRSPGNSAAPAQVNLGNVPPKSSTTGLSDHMPRNPSQIEQLSQAKVSPEKFEIDSFENNAGPKFWQRIKDKLFPEKEGVGNTRQKIMVVLIPVLFIVMIFMFRQVLSRSPRETEGALNGDVPVVTAVVSDNDIDWKIPEPMPVTMRDPIKLGAQNTPDDSGQAGISDVSGTGIISVRGILYSDDMPSAVVGNKIVHLNELIDGAKIIKIDKEYVVFEKDGKTWTKKVAQLNLEQEQQEQIEQVSGPDDNQGLEEDLSK